MSEIRLLSIDDDKEISHLVGRIAMEMGFSVCIANDPDDIIPLYKSFQPQIIILDILMPETDGFEVLKFLSEDKSKSHILILSGSRYNDLATNMLIALNLNIAGNLYKPFRLETLRQALMEIKCIIKSMESQDANQWK